MKHRACVTAFILTLFFPVALQGQDQSVTRIMLQGIVMDSESLEPLPNSQIFINKRFNSVSNSHGSFAVYVNVQDTLMVSRLGYMPASLVIDDSLTRKPIVAGIFLTTDTIEIAEVVIIPRLASLRQDIMNPRMNTSPEIQNARNNLAVSAYTARTTTGKLGDPDMNYGVIRQHQKIDAFEKGQIPSDRILGLSPFMILPAAYMLIKGLPERPPAYKPDAEISDYELQQLRKAFLELK